MIMVHLKYIYAYCYYYASGIETQLLSLKLGEKHKNKIK